MRTGVRKGSTRSENTKQTESLGLQPLTSRLYTIKLITVQLVFVICLLWPLCLGRALYWGDILLYFQPMWKFAQARLQIGYIPLWNPLPLGGQPFVGNPQEGVFYPFTVLLPFMPVWAYMNLLLVVHLLLAGVFAALFLRRWSSPNSDCVGSILGGMVYSGSEYLIGRIQFPPMIFTAAYLPLMLYCVDRCIDAFADYNGLRQSAGVLDAVSDFIRDVRRQNNRYERRSKGSDKGSDLVEASRLLVPLLMLGTTTGLMLLAAHPQMAYLILLLVTPYAMARLVVLSNIPIGNLPSNNFRNGFRTVEVDAVEVDAVAVRAVKVEATTDRSSNALGVVLWRLTIGSRRVRMAIALMAAGLLGCMLAGVQLVPTIQLLIESNREKLTAAQVNRFYMEPGRLVSLILPRFFGHPMSGDHWGLGNAWEPAVFIGWLPLVAGMFIVIRCWHRRFIQFWAMVSLIGFWLATGNMGGLFWIGYKFMPGLSNFHDPARFLLYPTFAIALLSGLGWDRLMLPFMNRVRMPRFEKPGVSLLAFTGFGLPLVFFGQNWNPTIAPPSLDIHPSEHITKHSAIAGRTFMPVHDRLWKHFVTDGYSDWDTVRPDSLQSYVNTLMPNIGMNEGIASASGYEPVPVIGTALMERTTAYAIRQAQPTSASLLFLMGVGTVVLPNTVRVTEPGLEVRGIDSHLPVTQLGTLKRPQSAWIVHRVRHIEGTNRVMATISAPKFDPALEAIISDSQNDEIVVPGTRQKAEVQGLTADIVLPVAKFRRGPCSSIEESFIVTNSGDTGLMVFGQTGYPGWKATVDGKAVAVYRVDGVLMGGLVPHGEHRVDLVYAPDTYRIGLYFSLLAALVFSVGAMFEFVLRWKWKSV